MACNFKKYSRFLFCSLMTLNCKLNITRQYNIFKIIAKNLEHMIKNCSTIWNTDNENTLYESLSRRIQLSFYITYLRLNLKWS